MLNSLKYKFHKARRKTEGKPAHGELIALVDKKKFYLDDITVLLQRGSDINEQNAYGNTALMVTAWRGLDTSAKTLIDNKADVRLKNLQGNNALMLAAQYDSLNIIRMIHAADPTLLNEVNENGDTALMLAARAGNLNMVELLINLGANIDIQNKQGKSASVLAHEMIQKALRDDNVYAISPYNKIISALSMQRSKEILILIDKTKKAATAYKDKTPKI